MTIIDNVTYYLQFASCMHKCFQFSHVSYHTLAMAFRRDHSFFPSERVICCIVSGVADNAISVIHLLLAFHLVGQRCIRCIGGG